MTTPNSQAVVQKKRDVRDLISSSACKAEIAKVLPKHLTPERMTRVALTATLKNPQLLQCSPESLMNALLVCSQAGLEPDGRLAHLIPYGQVVQVIFDYKGLVTLALRNGAESVFADKVCEFDEFEAGVVDGKKIINHKIQWGKERGTVICYYAVCRRAGEVDWEVMTVEEVEEIRGRSRASKNGPWVTDYDEMGKKTVLRRMSKRWDLLPEIRDVMYADDDNPPGLGTVAPVSRPLFNAPQLPDASAGAESDSALTERPPRSNSADSQSEIAPAPASSEPDPEADLAPQIPAAASSGANPLKALRNLLKIEKIKEGELLDWMAATGSTDGSMTSMEEVQLQSPHVIKLVYDQWQDIVVRIRQARERQRIL